VGSCSVRGIDLLACCVLENVRHDGALPRIVFVQALVPHDPGRTIEQALIAVAGEPLGSEAARLEHRVNLIDMALLRSVGARRIAADGSVFRSLQSTRL